MALNKKFFPKVSAAADTFTPSEHFNTVLYTGTGSAQRIGGYINRGAVFNGSNSTITIPDSSVFDFVNATSMSFFVNRNTTNRDFIIDKANGGSGSYGWQLEYFGTTKGYQFQIHNTSDAVLSGLETGANSTTLNWEHIVVTHNGSGEFKIYFNGVLKATQTLSGTVSTNTGDVKIGTYQLSSGFEFDGKLDQLRFFNKALSQSEVTTLYGETFASTTISTTDIFNDNSGVALYQLDGNANDTGGVSGKYGAAAHFNGSSSVLDTTISVSTNWTVSLWLKRTPNGYFGGTTNSNVRSGVYFYANSNGSLQVYNRNSSGGNIDTLTTSTGLVTEGTWHHIAIAFDSTSGTGLTTVYIDGTSAGTLDGTPTHSTNFKFGRSGDYTTEYFNGLIDDIRIYSDVLTSTEVGYIYNNTTASIPSDNLTAYYKLNGDARDETVPSYDGAASNVTYAYDGTESNITYQEATKFQPDLVWIKQRNGTQVPIWYDSVRGVHNYIFSSGTDAEGTSSATLTSFDSNGFSVGNSNSENQSGYNFVAWCFKAGGTKVANTDGNLTGTVNVSANTDSGFSIVEFTSESGSGKTAGHGLGVAPKLVIFKRLDSSESWWTFTTVIDDSYDYLILNSSAGKADATEAAPTDSVITQPTTASGRDYIAYCFHDVAGYQKIGSYTGNGSANGTIVETGFEPAFVMIKRTDTSANWRILDNKRSPSNPREKELYPNLTIAEGDYDAIDFLSNGFQNISTDASYNASGGTYIYLAIAADPDTTTPTVADSFDVVTYTGNGATNQDIETDFKPDLIWVKSRSTAKGHIISDSVRVDGTLNSLPLISSNLTDAESSGTDAGGNYIRTINSNGFSVGNSLFTGANGTDYVAWCWKAGDHDDNLPQINTEGTIDSIVSVNDAAGFSIVKYTGTGSNATIGHGLSNPPELIFVKTLDTVDNWMVLSTDIGATKKASLNATNAFDTDSAPWNDTAPTSTVFSVGTKDATNKSGDEFIAYCWYSVAGHSKIGTYDSSYPNTPAINVGFAPRFVLIKSYNQNRNWAIHDTQRGDDFQLYANLSSSEGNLGTQVQLTSTGFEVSGGGADQDGGSGYSYIYMAFK